MGLSCLYGTTWFECVHRVEMLREINFIICLLLCFSVFGNISYPGLHVIPFTIGYTTVGFDEIYDRFIEIREFEETSDSLCCLYFSVLGSTGNSDIVSQILFV